MNRPFSLKENLIFHLLFLRLIWAFNILGDMVEDGQAKMETVLVAAKKELVDQRLEVLTTSGLRPVVVDVDAFTLENAYELNHSAGEIPETVLSINIGASVTSMIIMENGLSRLCEMCLLLVTISTNRCSEFLIARMRKLKS